MHKLIILIETPADTDQFDESWPSFLREAEQMPGLVREATIRIKRSLLGDYDFSMIHELFFESYDSLQKAMVSNQGQICGQILQKITRGRMALLIAEHREDKLENIKQFKDEQSHENIG
jgi:uncharacterized protein (TIGR02118 family)